MIMPMVRHPISTCPMPKSEFANTAIAAVFAKFTKPVRGRLIDIRHMIFDVASTTTGVGQIEGALRWGQPSYLTSQSGSGSTIRLGTLRGHEDSSVLFFHCQSGLADEFRQIYGSRLLIEGNRSLVFRNDAPLPEPELRHCIGLALTYHRRKRSRSAAKA